MLDNAKLVPATDEEIAEAINEVLDEMDDEIKAIFDEEDLEAEAIAEEFAAAETVEERTAIMKKYKIGQYREGAEGVFFID